MKTSARWSVAPLLLATCAFVYWFALPVAARVSASASASIDEGALTILKRSSNVMNALKTYRAQCWTSTRYDLKEPSATGRRHSAIPAKFTLTTLISQKPNLMRYEQWPMLVQANGVWSRKEQTPLTKIVGDGKTFKQKDGNNYQLYDAAIPEELVTCVQPWAGFYSGTGSPYAMVVVAHESGTLLQLRHEGAEVVDGILCDKVFACLRLPRKDLVCEQRFTWYIGTDSLVHRQIFWRAYGNDPLVTEDAVVRNVQVNPPLKDRSLIFSFSAPRGVTFEKN